MWLDPDRRGTPAPGDIPQGGNATEMGDPVVMAVRRATGLPPRRLENFLRHDRVDLIYRTRSAAQADPIEQAIRTVLNDERGWDMAGLHVEESLMTRDLARVAATPEAGFVFTQEYSFEYLWPYPE